MDNESTLSFWNVFFDNIYKYPEKPTYKDKQDISEFITKYGKQSIYPIIQNTYNKYIDDFKNNIKDRKSLLKWGANFYNKVLNDIGCIEDYNCDHINTNVYKKYNNAFFIPLNSKILEEWYENGNTGVPRIYNCKLKDNFVDYKCINNIRECHKKNKKERYIKFAIFFGFGVVIGIICYKVVTKLKNKKIQLNYLFFIFLLE